MSFATYIEDVEDELLERERSENFIAHQKLSELGRLDEYYAFTTDPAKREELIREFGIEVDDEDNA